MERSRRPLGWHALGPGVGVAIVAVGLLTGVGCQDVPSDDDVTAATASPEPGYAAMEVAPATVSFGEVLLGETAQQTVTVTSDGGAALELTVTLEDSGGAFALEAGDGSSTLQPGERLEVLVAFSPVVPGLAEATLTIVSNDEDRPVVDVPVSGTGYQVDDDGDTFSPPDDCDDSDPMVNPDAEEVCDGVDNDCDGEVDEGVEPVTAYLDADSDGYGTEDSAVSDCVVPEGYVQEAGDCDDGDPAVYPGADEACDGRDNDCDGQIDEDVTWTTFYADGDQDGHGDPATTAEGCAPPPGFVTSDDDCDDADPDVYPGHEEACDGVDNDCDGQVDEDVVFSTYYADADGDGHGDAADSVTACAPPDGYVAEGDDCDDSDPGRFPGANELCDEVDNDCDGEVDEDAAEAATWYQDEDGDGYGTADSTTRGCTAPEGYVATPGDCDDTDPAYHPGAPEDDCSDPNDYNCDGSTSYADNDGDGFAACEECDDGDAAINPGADEVCDGVDNDCDGEVDEGVLQTWYADLDNDGFGDPATSLEQCPPGPDGYVTEGTDCNDRNAQVFPDASEVCNGKDDDCDGQIDEPGALGCTSAYVDADGDGWGGDEVACACGLGVGYTTRTGDCDDGNVQVFPGAVEQCNGVDDNCDTIVDEPGARNCDKYYYDGDQDGYGVSADSECLCGPEGAYTATAGGDCGDDDPDMYPANLEQCDGKDNNCNGQVDEGVQTTYYIDEDGDGFGASYGTEQACTQPDGYAVRAGDCNDFNEEIYPMAPEQCNELDDDCDGRVDEDLETQTIYMDGDGDGYAPDGALSQDKCDVPVGWTTEQDCNGDGLADWDCDDTRFTAHPCADELCDGVDNNCNGYIDTQCPSTCTGNWPVIMTLPSHMPARLLDYNGESIEELYIIDAAGKLYAISFQGTPTPICPSLTFSTGYGSKFTFVVNPALGAWTYYFVQGTRIYDLASCVEVYPSAGDVDAFGSVGDFAGDRVLDLAGHDEMNPALCAKLSTRDFTTQCVSSPNGKVYDGYLSSYDVDGDGKAELVAVRGRTYPDSSYYDGSVDVWGYDGASWTLEATIDASDTDFIGAHISGMDVADWFGDGFEQMTVLFGGKVMDLDTLSVVDTYTGGAIPNPRTFDVDGDGLLDGVSQGVLVDLDLDGVPESLRASGNVIEVVKNAPGTPVMDGWPVSIGTVTWSVQPVAGDVENDGRLDVFVPSVEGAIYCYRLGPGSAGTSNVIERGEPSWVNRTMTKDPGEPNDELAAAWPLHFPTKELRAYLTPGDVDYYHLPGVGGLYIHLYSPPGLDYDWVWTNEDGTITYATSTNGVGEEDAKAVCVACTQTVPAGYVVKVYPKDPEVDHSSTYPYLLKISRIP